MIRATGDTMANQDVPARHGRDKKYRMDNIEIDHPTPTLNAGGRWILPKDAMPSLNKGWYDASCTPFQRTHKYGVCFISDPAQFCATNTLNPVKEHPRFKDYPENYKQHQDFVQQKIFGGTETNGFVHFAQQALDRSISDLHDREDNVEFVWDGKQPRTREDVMELMFGEGGPGMTEITNGNYDSAVAQVLKYACMVTRHGGDSSRFVQGIEAWRNENQFPFELGMTTVSRRRMDLRGLISIARRVSCNVWYTNLSSRMTHKWKLSFW